jgi:thiamine pyrophosphokinase
VKGVGFLMKQAIIFANGSMENPQQIQSEIQSSSLIIAVDGGTKNCKKYGLHPNVIIGDLDSMDSTEIKAYQDSNVQLLQYPTHKNETDLELALHYVVKNEIDEVVILGALGVRWDMTISNILLIANPAFDTLHIRILDGNQELFLLRAGTSSGIHGNTGDIVSLIPLAGDVIGITTNGLEYPLIDEDLVFGAARGVSNVLLHDNAQIFFKEGQLLCTVIRN